MHKTVDALVRVGYAAKGIVYILVGALALRVAAGIGGGRLTDPGGALYVVLAKPFGTQLLLILSVGLLSYATWEIVSALLGWRRHARDGWGSRALTIVRALVYAIIGYKGLRLAMGLRAGESGPEPLVRAALHWPGGKWLVLAAGAGAVIYGIIEIRDAIKGRLEPDLDASTLRLRAGEWALHMARGGIIARAVVLVLLGITVVRAAMTERASAAGGIDASLVVLHSLPTGAVILGAAAIGLLAYGVYQMFHARWAQL